MKSPLADCTYMSSFILLGGAGLLMVIVTITDRGDMTSAALVIASVILFLTGIFLFTFVKTNAVDGSLSSLIPVQNQINICRIASDIGIKGNAWFIPKDHVGSESPMQFIPVSSYRGGDLKGNTFVSGQAGAGILIPPAGETIRVDLMKKSGVVIPETLPDLLGMIKEIGEEILEISGTIEVTHTGNGVSITMDNYLLIQGCREMMRESPACCQLHPCAICSLFGSFISEGLKQPIMIEQCRPHGTGSRVDMVFSIMESSTPDF